MTSDNPLAYYIGYTKNQKDRFKASSGGVGTAIMRYLLAQPEYGTSITFVFDWMKCMYVPKIVHSSEEINVCGSIYHDIDIAAFVKNNICNIKGGVVVSCPPCQVTAIRQILQRNNIHGFIISYCCSGQTTIEGTWKYYELIGIKKEEVYNMQYRGNGWPSGIQIWLNDGTIVRKDNFTEPWVSLHQSKLYAPKRCLYCKRDTGRNADISLGDPWLDRYKSSERLGATMFLPFTELGLGVIKNMGQNGLIEYINSNYDEYAIAQAPNIYKEIRLREQTSYIKKYNVLISQKWYFNWATKNISHIKINNFLFRNLYRFSSFRNFKSSFVKVIGKMIRF